MVSMEQVSVGHVCAVWGVVEPLLARAMVHSAGEYSLEQLKVFLVSGQQHLLTFLDDGRVIGAMTVATECYPNATVACVTTMGGRKIATKENMALLSDWCRARGYTSIRGSTFDPATRLWRKLGMTEIYRVMEQKL